MTAVLNPHLSHCRNIELHELSLGRILVPLEVNENSWNYWWWLIALIIELLDWQYSIKPMLPNPHRYQGVKLATNHEVQMKLSLIAHASKPVILHKINVTESMLISRREVVNKLWGANEISTHCACVKAYTHASVIINNFVKVYNMQFQELCILKNR